MNLVDTTSAATPWSRAADWLARRGDGFWALALLAVGALIYLPFLGSYPLWDPWESHYTQVAWEMQERLTWLNPWYRGEDNWWSKPILLLWMLRASLALFWDSIGAFADHELAARLPFAVAAILGGLLQYDWVRRLYGRAAGVLAALVLITAPQYLVIGRQVMIDVTFVVTYAASLGYLAVGFFTPRPPLAPRDAAPLVRARAWLAHNGPFAAFWVLQAVSCLAKGFVAQTLIVITLAGYAIATFRWSDYAELVAGRRWWRYLLVRGGIAVGVLAGAGAVAYVLPPMVREQRLLYQALIVGVAGLAVFLGGFHDFPLSRHALHLVRRMRVSWGLPLFFAVAAPWYVYMTVQHGWPYWKEFIFYHHLGRAAGTIDKPGNTFDYFVRQVAYGLFPWSAFLPVAIWKFFGRASPLRSVAERSNFLLLLSVALPYLFFSLQGTKFAHYVFPVLPLLAVMLALAILWLGREEPARPPLAEEGPPLGPPVPPSSPADEMPWWQRVGAKGDFIVVVASLLIVFGILSYDLVADYRHFLRLFLYYWNRATPSEYQPYIALQVFFFPMGITLGLLLLSRWMSRAHVAVYGALAVGLACYLAWVTMPAMKHTYSFKPFYYAYQELAKPGEPIGQYNDWQQPVRSVIFLFQNRCVHLNTDKRAEAFLQRPGRKFVLVDSARLAALRRVAAKLGKKLFVVAKGHPYAVMVSDVPNPEDELLADQSVLSALPADATRVDADFEGKIRLAGWKLARPAVRPGEEVEVTLYYEAKALMDEDWQIFVHGDGPRGSSRRLHGDHYPVKGLYPTTEWQEGDLVADTFTLRVPASYPYDWFNIWTGFYSADRRMQVSGGTSDGDNRVRGPRVSVVRSGF